MATIRTPEPSWDGPTTLQNIERFYPQFIVLDLFLPRMNGISILREI
ncbi:MULTISPECIES: hypothetical protein [unclassified Oceanispirochaeta]|nr:MULTISPECIES: hypothetical protein [unclassified Oceanispirochaeta]MBF9015182.1 hypothetical protein [Oceanispirochaeta sp. M2]NPD71640.1 hypothetical protein [Oceanispirochaeta sp. M1]